jgi:DTW domain-containing protein YfiP
MTELTPDELDAIRERAEYATPGPWSDVGEECAKGPSACLCDLHFIAHARTDVPALLEHIAVLKESRAATLQALGEALAAREEAPDAQ